MQSFQYSQKPNELLLINLGNLFFEDKQYKKAINFFSQAKKKNPQNFYALKKIFTCYIQLINLEKNLLIIERKSLADLESSIKDGRYENQSYRLDGLPVINHNIYYSYILYHLLLYKF